MQYTHEQMKNMLHGAYKKLKSYYFYDKFLVNKRQLSTMALAYACQIVDEIPREAHDIRMDKIVTEEIIYSFLRL